MEKISLNIWSSEIAAWKVFIIALSYYIVVSTFVFFLFNLFFEDLYVGQFSGHINIYTYFFSDAKSGLFSNPSVVDFAYKINNGFGEFYQKVAEYSLTSNENSSTVLFLGIYNFILFTFWIWWAISLWKNSKNTNSAFFSGFLKFVSVNSLIYPIYYFILSFMFLNAYSYGKPIVDHIDNLKNYEISENFEIDYYDIGFTLKNDWTLDEKSSSIFILKNCLNEQKKECGFMIIKRLKKEDISLTIPEMEKWIKYLNPTHEILSKSNLKFKDNDLIYFNYSNVYKNSNSVVKTIAFEAENGKYIIDWIAPEKNKEEYFKIYGNIFSTLYINN